MNDASESRDASSDVMAMSFLDVLSCGLGGSICLFLVFSVLPQFGDQSSLANFQGNATKQTAFLGARFRDYSDVVRNAYVFIEITSSRQLESDTIQVSGLRSMQKVYVKTFDSDAGSRTTIQIPNGVDPRRVLRITYKGALSGDVTFTAEAKVGASRNGEDGHTPTSTTVTISSDEELELFNIDFNREDAWIEATNSN